MIRISIDFRECETRAEGFVVRLRSPQSIGGASHYEEKMVREIMSELGHYLEIRAQIEEEGQRARKAASDAATRALVAAESRKFSPATSLSQLLADLGGKVAARGQRNPQDAETFDAYMNRIEQLARAGK